MKFFQVLEKNDESTSGYFEGFHKWKLPGVYCEVCGNSWATTGISYPSIELPMEIAKRVDNCSKLIPYDEFLGIKEQIRSFFPMITHIAPGTTFGPLDGAVYGGQVKGFIPSVPWDLLIADSVLTSLKVEVNLNVVGVNLKTDIGRRIYEAELRPHGIVGNKDETKRIYERCLYCGVKDDRRVPENIRLIKNSIPSEVDVFRLIDFPTVIIASERFAKIVNELNLNGIVFKEIVTSN